MTRKTSIAVLSALVALLVSSGQAVSARRPGNSAPAPSRPATCIPTEGCMPTFSTKNLGRMGNFYVGGKWEGKPDQEVMVGAMYVEVLVPK